MLSEPSENRTVFLDDMVERLEREVIPALRTAGLDSFVLFTTPPIYRAPGIPPNLRGTRRQLEAHWNRRLRGIGGVRVFDVEPIVTAALDRPDRYGFKHGDDLCAGYADLPTVPVAADFHSPDCPDPIDAYIWRDSLRASKRSVWR